MKPISIGTTFFVWLLLRLLQAESAKFLDPDCGIRAPSLRIKNGTVAGRTSSPWMVFIHSTDNRFVCGGTLITHRLVLTAAHCFLPNLSLVARLGEYQRSGGAGCHETIRGTQYCTHTETVAVDLGIKHRLYDGRNQANDIALLRLARRVVYQDHIKPICIVVRKDWRSFIDALDPLTATGWGRTEKEDDAEYLMTLEISRQNRTLCTAYTGKVLASNQFCAGNVDGNLCFGDSGGPVGKLIMTDNSPRFIQVGIASFTNAQCERVSAFTDVLSHVDWILNAVRQYGNGFSQRTQVRAPTKKNPNRHRTVYYLQ